MSQDILLDDLNNQSQLCLNDIDLFLQGLSDDEKNIEKENNEPKHLGRKRKLQDIEKYPITNSNDELVNKNEKNKSISIDNDINYGRDKKTGKLCLNPLDNGELPSTNPIMLCKRLSKRLKLHQIAGLKFLWKHISKEPNGQGCILADYMGLGKTLQVISLIHVFLNVKEENNEDDIWAGSGYERELSNKYNKVLVITPAICVKNWEAEFHRWLSNDNIVESQLYILESSKDKDIKTRIHTIKLWHENGGILVMGYELYRILVLQAYGNITDFISPFIKKWLNNIKIYLCNPGPDLVILDEAHRIREPKSKLVTALSKISTKRRVLLTGYPLQNHLSEYWTMVSFARPNYLGTKEDFKQQFEDPITNGQCIDSSITDIRIARQRAYVLTEELREIVLRRDQKYLCQQLPPKSELVILCRLSKFQFIAYKAFLRNILSQEKVSIRVKNDVLVGYHISLTIGNHPDIFYRCYNDEKLKLEGKKSNSKYDIETAEIECLNDEIQNENDNNEDFVLVKSVPAPSGDNCHRYSFASSFMNDLEPDILANSGKMFLLFEILKESIILNDKVTVFSQSLLTLDVIEKYIKQFNNGKNKVYIRHGRIDGSTSASSRFELIQQFNRENSRLNVILISTKAGGEGINLCGGNRIVIFDVCWNPCHDSQSTCRSYRFGQKKPVYIYRLISDGTMEKKVYDLQVSKEGVSRRIIDDKFIERKFRTDELKNYFDINYLKITQKENKTFEQLAAKLSKKGQLHDSVLSKILLTSRDWITDIYEQDTMFEEDLAEMCPQEEKEFALSNYRTRHNSNVKNMMPNAITIECVNCKNFNFRSMDIVTKNIVCGFCNMEMDISSQVKRFDNNLSNNDKSININQVTARKIPIGLSLESIQGNISNQNFSIVTQTISDPLCSSSVIENYKTSILNKKHILLIRKGIKNPHLLENAAKHCGAIFDIELTEKTHYVVSCFSLKEVLQWLRLSSLPNHTKYEHVAWLETIAFENNNHMIERNPVADTNGNRSVINISDDEDLGKLNEVELSSDDERESENDEEDLGSIQRIMNELEQ